MTDLSIVAYWGGRLPTVTDEDRIAGLSERQRKVLYLLSKGMTFAEIALETDSSQTAVKSVKAKIIEHIGNAQYKREVYRRAT